MRRSHVGPVAFLTAAADSRPDSPDSDAPPLLDNTELRQATRAARRRGCAPQQKSVSAEIRSRTSEIVHATTTQLGAEAAADEAGRDGVEAQLLEVAHRRCERVKRRYDHVRVAAAEREAAQRELQLELDAEAASEAPNLGGGGEAPGPVTRLTEQIAETERQLELSLFYGGTLRLIGARARTLRQAALSQLEAQADVASATGAQAAETLALGDAAASALGAARVELVDTREALHEQRDVLRSLAARRQSQRDVVHAVAASKRDDKKAALLGRLSSMSDRSAKSELRLLERASNVERASLSLTLGTAMTTARERKLADRFFRLRLAMPDPSEVRTPAQLVKVALRRRERTESLQAQHAAASARLEAARAELRQLRADGTARGIIVGTLPHGGGATDADGAAATDALRANLHASDAHHAPSKDAIGALHVAGDGGHGFPSTGGPRGSASSSNAPTARRGVSAAAVSDGGADETRSAEAVLDLARRRKERAYSRLADSEKLLRSVREGVSTLLRSCLGDEMTPAAGDLPDRLDFVGRYLQKLYASIEPSSPTDAKRRRAVANGATAHDERPKPSLPRLSPRGETRNVRVVPLVELERVLYADAILAVEAARDEDDDDGGGGGDEGVRPLLYAAGLRGRMSMRRRPRQLAPRAVLQPVLADEAA